MNMDLAWVGKISNQDRKVVRKKEGRGKTKYILGEDHRTRFSVLPPECVGKSTSCSSPLATIKLHRILEVIEV